MSPYVTCDSAAKIGKRIKEKKRKGKKIKKTKREEENKRKIKGKRERNYMKRII